MAYKVLILGGTTEAVALTRLLAGEARFETVTSLAGRTRQPTPMAGTTRVGGFGGVDGLCAYLCSENIELVVDATHPYAEEISRHAASACAVFSVPRLQLWRPAWQRVDGDEWFEVTNMSDAAEVVKRRSDPKSATVFLSTGTQHLAVFAELRDMHFLLRLIEAPGEPIPLVDYELVLARGPFSERHELSLFQNHRVSMLISKNSGGEATYAKIVAARKLKIPVVMLARPAAESGPTVKTPADAFTWIKEHAFV